MICPYCGSEDQLEYIGVDDGDGYLCDCWRCHECSNEFQTNCLEVED